jgi:hypothetical protein
MTFKKSVLMVKTQLLLTRDVLQICFNHMADIRRMTFGKHCHRIDAFVLWVLDHRKTRVSDSLIAQLSSYELPCAVPKINRCSLETLPDEVRVKALADPLFVYTALGRSRFPLKRMAHSLNVNPDPLSGSEITQWDNAEDQIDLDFLANHSDCRVELNLADVDASGMRNLREQLRMRGATVTDQVLESDISQIEFINMFRQT